MKVMPVPRFGERIVTSAIKYSENIPRRKNAASMNIRLTDEDTNLAPVKNLGERGNQFELKVDGENIKAIYTLLGRSNMYTEATIRLVPKDIQPLIKALSENCTFENSNPRWYKGFPEAIKVFKRAVGIK